MDLTDAESTAIEKLYHTDVQAFSMAFVTENGEVDGTYEGQSDDGTINAGNMGSILATQVATVADPGKVDELCDLIAERAKRIQEASD